MPPKPNNSRPGCWTCKKRHRKCDEFRPSCRKCALYGEECEGFGRQRLAWRDNTAKVQEKHRITGLSMTPIRSISPKALTTISRQDQAVLHGFIESVALELALTESYNIWRDDIAQMISDERNQFLLLHAVLAVTLVHRTHLEFRITCDAAKHYDCAVKNLQTALDTANFPQSDQLDVVLATLFLLTWFEILGQDWEKWNVHLAALANLINTLDPGQISNSRFRQRLISAIARLDVPNTIWRLNPLLLSRQFYDLLRARNQSHEETQSLDEAAILAFDGLHAIMAQFAAIYADWLRGSLSSLGVSAWMLHILDELAIWHSSLPHGLQWSDIHVTNPPPPKSSLQRTLLVHYLSSKLFALYVLNPDCAVPGDATYKFCHRIAQTICTLINGLGPPEKRNSTRFRGDVGVILPLSIASMFLRTDAERKWACHWARHANHEGMWCGRRRSMIMGAWGRCQEENMSTHPVHTLVGADNIYWKPGKYLNVCIMTHDISEGLAQAVEVYCVNEDE